MHMTVSDFVATLVSSGVLVWLFQTWIGERLKGAIKHEYEVELAKLKSSSQDAELEIHKAALQAGNVAAIERLKSDLQVAAAERQIRFSKLHEKVAESVFGVWLRLKKVMGAVGDYTSELETPSMGSKKERREAMAEAMKEFREYFYENSIYFPADLNERVTRFNTSLWDIAYNFLVHVDQNERQVDGGIDKWLEIRRDLGDKGMARG